MVTRRLSPLQTRARPPRGSGLSRGEKSVCLEAPESCIESPLCRLWPWDNKPYFLGLTWRFSASVYRALSVQCLVCEKSVSNTGSSFHLRSR